MPRCLSFALALVLTLGCRTVLPTSDKSDYFVLTALEPVPDATPGPSAPSVLLGPVALPAYLDRRELVTRLGSNQLQAEDLELWAEPLRDSLPRTLEQDLTALLGTGRVQRLPWTGRAAPEVAVVVELQRFEKTRDGRVEVEACWTISDVRSATARVQRQTHVSLPAGTTTQSAVASLSQGLAALSREIAAGLRLVATTPFRSDTAAR